MKERIESIISFTKRDFTQKYVGTSFGKLWFVLSPVIMISIYSIVFSNVMHAKLGVSTSIFAYSVYLISGLLAWLSFSSTLNALSIIFSTHAHFIKKISIPIYVFYISTTLSQAIAFAISVLIAVLFLAVVDFGVSFYLLFLIPLMVLQIIFAFSMGVIFSLFYPFFKDLKVIIPIVLQLWFWTTPIIYFKDIVSTKFHILFTINPFYYFVESYHAIFFYQSAPEMAHIGIATTITFVLFAIAVYLYKKMIPTIKDII